jgi:uncharacterized protein (DUF924 family)
MSGTERWREVLEFWFGPQADARLWFGGDPAVDREVRRRFAGLLDEALAGRLEAWEASPESTVALVVLLDQFSLQLHRKQRQGYEGSTLALAVSQRAIAKGFDAQLGCAMRGFLYMPFMHAEDLALQERSVALFSDLARRFEGELSIGGFLKSAIEHRDIVRRFGRFPGRNRAYARETTPEERDYLEKGGHF